MAKVTTPGGVSFEETNPTALAYYRREQGYTVEDSTPSTATPAPVKAAPPAGPPAAPPASS